MSERVLVTGGCGFVGAHLCDRLVERGDEVVAFDNFSRGSDEDLSSGARAEIEIVEGDVRDSEAVRRALASHRPASLFHLAAIHFIPECDQNPVATIDVNTVGTQVVLQACAETTCVKKLTLASTAAVYAPSFEAHHEASELGPTDIYGHTKLWSEQLCELFHRRTGASVGIARLFNVYGPGETNPHLIPTVLKQAERVGELWLGNLGTRRDYVYAGDVVAGLLSIDGGLGEGALRAYNLGSERAVDGAAVVAAVSEIIGRDLQVATDPERLRASDRPVLLSDCSRAQAELGWKATTGLTDGLRAALRHPVAARVEIT